MKKFYLRYFIRVAASLACTAFLLAGCTNGPQEQSKAEEQTSALSSSEPALQTGTAVRASSVWAGTRSPGFCDGANNQAEFIKPYGLCAAPDGGVVIVDCYANLLRMSSGSTVATIAGNVEALDQAGYPLGSYLNGEGREAYLNRPRFAVCSAEGSLVFSDTGNHRIRILLNGMVRLLAGSGEQGYRDGSYKDAEFNTPSGVAIDADGTIFVADTLNHSIRMISPDGQVSTLSGSPSKEGYRDGTLEEAQFCEPNDIQIGPDGALYLVDKGNQRIRRIKDDAVTTVAGSGDTKDPVTSYVVGGYRDGPASQAQFQYPTGLFVDESGCIYVADTGNNCIRFLSADGEVSTLAGTKMAGSVSGPVEKARFNQPLDVLAIGQTLYVTDSYNHTVCAVDLPDGKEG